MLQLVTQRTDVEPVQCIRTHNSAPRQQCNVGVLRLGIIRRDVDACHVAQLIGDTIPFQFQMCAVPVLEGTGDGRAALRHELTGLQVLSTTLNC